MTKFQSLTNFQYGVMNVRILMRPKIATLLYAYSFSHWIIEMVGKINLLRDIIKSADASGTFLNL